MNLARGTACSVLLGESLEPSAPPLVTLNGSMPDSNRNPAVPEATEPAGVQPRAKRLPLAPPTVEGVPELLPARMLNELLYCERLMYLEWVQGEWADNRYTSEGTLVHARVDKRPGVLRPRPETEEGAEGGEELPYSARSVWLSSERLGLTAKIDVVDVDGSRVVPIEYKRGKEPPMGPYMPERAQLAAQVLLLREHGYDCDHGEIYFAGERRRVSVAVDDSLIDLVQRSVERAKTLVLAGACPPPLEDSPKCNGCSLSGICLPDELRSLREAPEPVEVDAENDVLDVGDDPWDLVGPVPDPRFEPGVRRLFPARDDKIPVYVQGQGAAVRLSGGRLVITLPGEKATEVRLGNTSSVTLFGNVQITAQALHKLMDEGIPLLFATSGGWLLGRALGADTKNVELRAAQYRATLDDDFRSRLSRLIVHTKIQNCRTLLRRNHKGSPAVALGELQQLARKALTEEDTSSLLGLEGAAARAYFREFHGMLKPGLAHDFDFERRSRRPPRDPVNALLSFCYSLLVRETNVAAQAVGLDPLLGFYHQPRFGRPSLALDLMEEFRPVLADSTVISVINNGVVDAGDFVRGQDAVALKPAARKRVIHAMERRLDQLVTHPTFDYRLSYRRVLELQARLLSRVLLGELENYPAFKVR